MVYTCKQYCIHKYYPDGIPHITKLWDKRGFILCRTCGILVSREKYIHQVRCRCCNTQFSIRPRLASKRKRSENIEHKDMIFVPIPTILIPNRK